MNISLKDTRKLHLQNMLLLEPPKALDPVQIIRSLGWLQLDTLFVVARSQDLVLHSRSTTYKKEDIWNTYQQRKLFEGFAHARSLLPIEEFPYYYKKMFLRREKKPNWFEMVKHPQKLIERTLNHIRAHGEISTAEVPIDIEFKSSWSSLSKRILDYLALRGYIHVSRRKKFSTVYYDLVENIIPELPDSADLPSRLDIFWHEIEQTLDIHGLVPLHRLLHYTYAQKRFEYKGKRQYPRSLIKEAIKEQKLDKISIDGIEFYSKPRYLDTIEIPKVEDPEVFILSPFDNALWSRETLALQYEFDYKLEAYTPVKDRIHGYYSMPVLYGTRFVGRLDPKYHRDMEKLEIKNWSWEHNSELTSDFWDKFSLSLQRLCTFHGATSLDLGSLKNSYRKELEQRINL